MTPTDTIKALLAGAARTADEAGRAAARRAARVAWASEAIAAMAAAQERVDAAWQRIFEALPDDLDDEEVENLPEPPEQAELDALWTEIEAVRDHDRWPRELHWTL